MSGSPCRILSLVEGRFYEPLNSEVDEIRLLEDIQLQPDGAISCQLRSYPLRDAPGYVALSYTWGRFDSSLTIRVDGVAVPVRKNLLRFLKQAGHGRLLRRRPLFVDAVCINQYDESERSQQVQLMAKIYGTAEEVAAWLGPAYASSDLALRTIQSNNPVTLQKAWWGPAGVAICHLCNRAYWTRLWILQEIALARSVTFHCGKIAVPYGVLEAFVLDLQTPIDRGRTNIWYDATSSGSASSLLKQVRQARQASTLFTQMSLSKSLGCVEVRDRAYALLGLASSGGHNIRPDYTIGLTDLMNVILREELAINRPYSLWVLYRHCQTLVGLFDTDLETLFTLPPSSVELEAIKRAWPAHGRKDSPISYWWLSHWNPGALDLWTREYNQGDRFIYDFTEMMLSANLIATEFFLDAGFVNVNFVSSSRVLHSCQDWQAPPLLFAWRKCERTVLDVLLKRPELDVNVTDFDGQTLLGAAMMEDTRGLAYVRTLLDREDINIHAGASERGDLLAEAILQGAEHTALLLQHPQIDKKAHISRGLRQDGIPMPILYFTVYWIGELSDTPELFGYNGNLHRESMALLQLLLQDGFVDVNEIFHDRAWRLSEFSLGTTLDLAKRCLRSDLRKSVCELLSNKGARTATEIRNSGCRTLLELRGEQVRDRLQHEQRFQLAREAIWNTRATTWSTKAAVGTFADLGCKSEVTQAVNNLGLEGPTVIQRSLLSALTQGRNVILRASEGFRFASALAIACIEKINPRSRVLQVLLLHANSVEHTSFADWLLALDFCGSVRYSSDARWERAESTAMAPRLPHILVNEDIFPSRRLDDPGVEDLELVVCFATSDRSRKNFTVGAQDFLRTRVPESAQLVFLTTDLDLNFTQAMDESRAENTVDITITSR